MDFCRLEMALYLIIPDALYRFVTNSVSGGYVVALASVCLLQYFAQIHRLNRARRDQERVREELSGAVMLLGDAQQERAISEFENAALREFLTEPDRDRAIRRLLRRFVRNAEEGAGLLLRRRRDGWLVVQSIGLTDASIDAIEFDSRWESRLARGESLEMRGETLRASSLWNSLSQRDRTKLTRLFIFGIGREENLEGVLALTDLAPAGIEERRQITGVNRLLLGLTGSLRDRWRLESNQRQLRVTGEMLALRSIADRNFDSPLAMLSEFVRQSAEKTQSQRVTLFLYPQLNPTKSRALVSSGTQALPGVELQWTAHEERLAERGRTLREPLQLAGAELREAGVNSLIGVALLVPIHRKRRTVGLLCFTRRDAEEYCESRRQLATWAATLLAELLPRAVNHAVVVRKALLDPLTGLANRGEFDRRILQELQTAAANGGQCALLLLDLDRFKSINDRFGHRSGDAVLRATARIVLELVRMNQEHEFRGSASPFVARYGGEELAVLLPGMGTESALRVAEGIRAGLESQPVEFEGRTLPVTTSIGVAAFPEHADGAEELIAVADAALYRAKSLGRNRVQVATIKLVHEVF